MKKTILALSVLGVVLAGCTTYPDGSVHAMGCDRGTNYAGAGVGAVAGGLLGSVVGGGTGRLLATGAGAAVGGVVGSQSHIGC
jgi:outer membrane lipoprotein SlyB